MKALRTPDAVVDGEVVRPRCRTGRPSFSAMQQGSTRLAYEVFDLLEADGEPVVDLPLTERRARLEKLLAPNPVVQLSGVFEDGEALLEAAEELGLEGVMAKRPASRYSEGGRGARLAEDQDARPAGVRDLRLHEGPGPAQRQLRRARARRPPRPRVGVGRERGHRLQRASDRRAARAARALAAGRAAVPGRPEDAQGAERRRRLGRAEARGRGRVRGVDSRRAPARAVLPGTAQRQAGGGRAPRAAARRRRRGG